MNPDPLYVDEQEYRDLTFEAGYVKGLHDAPPALVGLILAAISGGFVGMIVAWAALR